MTTFVVTSCANLGLLLWVWWTGERGRVWLAARAGAGFSLVMLLAYWLPLSVVSQGTYRALWLATDLLSSAVDLYVLFGLVFDIDRCTPATLAVIAAVAWHQIVKLLWHWSAELFQQPSGVNAMLVPARRWSSWLVLAAMAAVAYCGDRTACEDERGG